MSSGNTADEGRVGAAAARGVATRARGTVVVGLGNPVLGDDGIGWRVVEEVRDRLAARDASAGGDPAGGPGAEAAPRCECAAVGGLALMERLVGYRRAILVDALVTGADPPGTIRRFGLADLPGREASHLDSAHDAPLEVALAAGRALGADLPDEIEIVSIEAVRVHEFREDLTTLVAAALPRAVELVLAILDAPAPGPSGSPATAG